MGWGRDERNLCRRTRLREPPPCPAGDLARARKSHGRAGARIRTPRQSHSLCDTAGARGWLGSRMTHPQWSPETLVGSFAQQVFSLMVSELCSRVNPSPVEQLERPLLAAPQLGAGWGIPARGLGTLLPRGGDALGCLGATGGASPGDLTAPSPFKRDRGTSSAPAALGTDGGASIKCSVPCPDPQRAEHPVISVQKTEHPSSSIPAPLGSYGMRNLP